MTIVDPARQETAHRFPRFLPDGRHFLYLRVSNKPENLGIYAGSIDTKPEEQSLKPLLLTDRQAMYAPALAGGPGRLLFLRDSTLFAQPFDPGRLELSGEPVPVADQVGSFAAATAGLYIGVRNRRAGVPRGRRRRPAPAHLVRPARQGPGHSRRQRCLTANPAVSPDGTRVAVTQLDRQEREFQHLGPGSCARGSWHEGDL